MKSVWSKTARTEKNRTLAFVYDHCGEQSEVLLKICASNVFRLFLNGALFGYGPRRSAHGYSNRNEYRLTLSRGDRIVAEVAGYCVNSYYLVNELPFFACEISAEGRILADAGQFRCFELDDRIRKVQRFSFQRPFAEAYRMRHDRMPFYCGKDLFPETETCEVSANIEQECDLPYPDFRRSGCKKIEEGSVKRAEEFWLYRDRSIYDIDDTLLGYRYDELEAKISDEACAFCYLSDGKTQPLMQERYRLYDFGRVITGFVSCKAEVEEQCDLYFLFDEILWHEVFENSQMARFFRKDCLPLIFFRMGTCNVIKYTLAPGRYDLLSFEPYNMRYLKVVCTGGRAKISDPEIVHYENADIFRTKFVCENKDLQKIFEAAQHTLAQNAVDVLTDCPCRERAGWLCDSFFSARAERLLTGENRVEENLLDAYLKAPALPQLPQGMFPMCYPADHYNGMYIPNWAMWFVIELEDYVKRTGNERFARQFRQKTENLLQFFTKYENSDGLLENLESWICVEHSKAAEFVQDVSYPTNMLYSKMLRSVYALYKDEQSLQKAEHVARKVREQSYNGTFFEDNRIRVNDVLKQTGNITETCQYYAFFTGVATKKEYPELYERMLHSFGPKRDVHKVYPNVYPSNAFIGNYLRLLYFYGQGEKMQVFKECKDYFLYMANRTMTLWEHDKAHASCDHAFASYPAIFIANCLTGFVKADAKKRVVYFERPVLKKNCSLRLPIDRRSYVEIEVSDGKMTRKVPNGYQIVDLE